MHCSLSDAIEHANSLLIYTQKELSVSLLHGGGLLKYATYVSRGFRVSEHLNVKKLENAMLVRFEMDYPDHEVEPRNNIPMSQHRLMQYYYTHCRTVEEQLSFFETLLAILKRGDKQNGQLFGMSQYMIGYLRQYMVHRSMVAAQQRHLLQMQATQQQTSEGGEVDETLPASENDRGSHLESSADSGMSSADEGESDPDQQDSPVVSAPNVSIPPIPVSQSSPTISRTPKTSRSKSRKERKPVSLQEITNGLSAL
jgi:hypothetical protein